jgi:hypothetical protein
MRRLTQGLYVAAILPHSLHRPVAVTDGSLTENFNKTAVRLWTGCSPSGR